MELHSDIESVEALLKLNNLFVTKYPYSEFVSHDYETKGTKKFLGMLSKNNKTLIAMDYIILGTYTSEQNVWTWSDMSVTMNKTMKQDVTRLRTVLIDILKERDDSKLMMFVENDYSVLPTLEVGAILARLAEYIADTTKSVLLTNGSGQYLNLIMVKKILYNSTQETDLEVKQL